ncbi:MAG: VanZ family protein [Tepidimonas taiwanensis]|nr:VanZ family protein [Tepidimonas taiwanensis]
MPALWSVWLLYLAFVVYGSLVPFDFQPRPWAEAWRLFRDIRLLDVGAQGRADWIANGVLYLPLGYLTVLALAAAVEFAQLAFPPRTVSLNDLLAEALGSLLGVGAAALWGGQLQRLAEGWLAGGRPLWTRLLQVYALAYLALSLFPYDFVLSPAELATKLQTGAWGLVLAPAAWQGGVAVFLARLAAEALAVVPLGLLAARGRGRVRPWSPAQALAAGALLGLAVETAQSFLVSGLSQGLSVATRALGFLAGAWLARRPELLQPRRLAAMIRRGLLPLGGFYLLALMAVNGWFERRWLEPGQAWQSLAGGRFLPFYYHYYTSEATALVSLIAVAAMYAPVGLAAWATWSSPALAFFLAAAAATAMETGKLFLEGLRPDPTNVWIGACAAWATAHLARRLTRAVQGQARWTPAITGVATPTAQPQSLPLSQPVREALASGVRAGGLRLRRPAAMGWGLLGLGLGATAWALAYYPLAPLWLGLGLALYAGLLWFRPQAWLIVVPAALPVLDLAPWSGRFFFDEFDLLLLVTVAVGYARLPAAARRQLADPWLGFVLALLVLATLVALLRGLSPWPAPDTDAFSHYYSPYNALRVGKGVLWALLLLGLYRRLQGRLPGTKDRLALGFALGLAGSVAWGLWERAAFPGLTDLDDRYRVTGPFSQMHVGTADLEAYLTLASPFLLYLIVKTHGPGLRLAGVLLLAAAGYAMAVSYSRIGALAFALALTLTLAGLWLAQRRRRPSAAGGLWALAALGLVAAAALPVLLGPFALQRLARAEADLDLRLRHWQEVLALRDADWTAQVLGMGLGSYPRTHQLRSPPERRAAGYRLMQDGQGRWLRLSAGSPLYVEQFVPVRPRQAYTLQLRARSAPLGSVLAVSLCEKWLLTSARCVSERLTLPEAGRWVSVGPLRLDAGALGETPWYARRPVKLSFMNPVLGTVVDVDDVTLLDADGRTLTRNGGFEQGLDHWFFAADAGPPWDVSSLPVALLFEQGWLGLLAYGLLLLTAIVRGAAAIQRGDAGAAAPWAAVVGGLVLGSLLALVASPRILLLLLLLAALVAGAAARPAGSGRAGQGLSMQAPGTQPVRGRPS